MKKSFKILETNLTNITDTHFICDAQVGKHSTVFDSDFRTTMFDGIKIKIINGENYLIGEVHGIQPE